MFTLFLIAINVATLALGLIKIGEQSNRPKDKDDDDDSGPFIPCM
jgi:hypothetical protein